MVQLLAMAVAAVLAWRCLEAVRRYVRETWVSEAWLRDQQRRECCLGWQDGPRWMSPAELKERARQERLDLMKNGTVRGRKEHVA
jgi:hypothetical protein